MGKAIGSSLPLAVGIALSPIPVIAVVLMLTSGRARVNGPAFVVGWLAGLGVIGAIILSLASPSRAGKSGGGARWLSWAEIVLGVLLLPIAVWQFRGRPRGGDEPPLPKWTATVDKTTPVAAVGLAVVLSGANPKNLVLAAGGTTAIARAGSPDPSKLLLRLKDWMTRHNASITIVLCLVIAAKLFGDAIGALTG